MADTVTIPRAEYDRLRAAEEDFTDLQDALGGRASTAACPGSPWRAAPARTASGSPKSKRAAPPAPWTLRALADALHVTVDDLLPG